RPPTNDKVRSTRAALRGIPCSGLPPRSTERRENRSMNQETEVAGSSEPATGVTDRALGTSEDGASSTETTGATGTGATGNEATGTRRRRRRGGRGRGGR